MIISLLVAMDAERGIGKDNRLPWHLSADLKRFKTLTMGHFLLMGRKTFESIGRALPGRKTIIVTRNPDFRIESSEGALELIYITYSITDALNVANEAGENEIFIIGGGEIFEQSLPLANRIYLTQVLARLDCDTFFPMLDLDQWDTQEEKYLPADEQNEYPTRFQLLSRK